IVVMQQHQHAMPLPLKWLMIGLITLVLGCALSSPASGPSLDLSKDESLAGTLVLQKKVYDDAGTSVDGDPHFDAVLSDSVHNPTVYRAILSGADHLAASFPLHFHSASPRGPPPSIRS